MSLGATTEARPTITQLLDNYETAVRKSANYGTSQYECDVIETERAVVNSFDALTEANAKLVLVVMAALQDIRMYDRVTNDVEALMRDAIVVTP